MVFLKDRTIPRKVKKFLEVVPYTSISILIIRSIMTTSQEMLLPTLVSCVVAIVIMLKKENIALSMTCGILATFGMLLLK